MQISELLPRKDLTEAATDGNEEIPHVGMLILAILVSVIEKLGPRPC